MKDAQQVRKHLLDGQAIPALPLALDRRRHWSENRQRAVLRYYIDAGVGGIAVGVHSTQFQIRDPRHGLFEPVLRLAQDTMEQWVPAKHRSFIAIAGICGRTSQAVGEATLVRRYGFEAGLLSVAAWKDDDERSIIHHCERVAEIIPLIGFYLQSAVGGRKLRYGFWRRFAEIPNVVAIKIAPFNRYQTLEVVRAVVDSGRDEIALYTGNDDNIIVDLMTPFEHTGRRRFIAGGLLGQWGVWTKRATELFAEIKQARGRGMINAAWLKRNADLTDANAAVFDAANGFVGCLPGINEILRRQGIFETAACLDPREKLSKGQADELDRVTRAYPWLVDDMFVRENLDRWLS